MRTKLQMIFGLLLLGSCGEVGIRNAASPLFEKVSPTESGIFFSNDLKFDRAFNIYTYRNFYNGGGVSLGDINNDGLLDIYFTANQKSNKLYLNKGNWVFEDITDSSGTGGKGAWSTGVTMADVNADGFLDIYVCNSGDVKGDNKQNELFINNGDLTFTESAIDYGLADRGFTTHAAFFDYDRDGDLDAYILNNSYQSIGSFNLKKNERPNRDSLGGDKLMRNDNGKFVDVSEKAGIYGSVIGFGLGVTLGDVNRDGWLDIFVSNDFFERDYLYVNQKDGTFREVLTEYMSSISGASMGADMADVNNDGWPDLFVTEMLPFDHDRLKTVTTFEDWNKYEYNVSNDYYHQFTRNMLQVNNQGESFSELGRLAGVESTDWSWGALFADFDNDGMRDVFVSNGIKQDLTDQDFLQYASSEEFVKSVIKKEGVDYEELVRVIPSRPVTNQIFKNKSRGAFESVGDSWGLNEPSFSNGAAYGDLDNDGDLDLVVNNVDQPAFLYRNNLNSDLARSLRFRLVGIGGNTGAIGACIDITTSEGHIFAEQIVTKGFQSSVDATLHVGVGADTLIASVEVRWPSGHVTSLKNVRSNQLLHLREIDAVEPGQVLTKSDLKTFLTLREAGFEPHVENQFNDFDRDRLRYHMVSNEGPKVCLGDVNGDGLDDFYVGGAKGYSGTLYIQQSNGHFFQQKSPFRDEKASEDCGCAFFDADGDGDLDLYVASGGYELPKASSALADRLYINNHGSFAASEQILPTPDYESTSAVAAADFDQDGDMDLFVGVRLEPFQYGVPTNGYLLENDGRGKFREVSQQRAPVLKGMGMVTDALWSDYDEDGDPDLLVVGEWLGIRLFNNNKGRFTEVSGSLGLKDTEGWWNKVIAYDLDGDGDDDYVLGNHGLNSRFKASKEKPVTMWVNDFDQNGTVEQIICRWWGDTQYPMALRHDLLSQLPGLKKKYLKYSSYKDQRVEDIFTADQLKRALKWEAKELRTSVLWNEGSKLRLDPLPLEAQYAPMYGLAAGDFTGDGKVDIVVGGNQYRAKPEVGRYDASYGALLAGDGRGGFKFVPSSESGLKIRGEVRSIVPLRVQGKPYLFFALNNDVPRLYEIKAP